MDKGLLDSFLKEYQDLTLQLIKLAENKEVESLKDLFDKRQSCIDKIENVDFTVNEFKALADELDIKLYEKKLNEALNNLKIFLKYEMDKNKKEMLSLKRQKNVNNMYSNIGASMPVFLSKKY